ncbi:MAG: chemotaxis protein CheW [bacterium]|nr:chemotaxis protein CheW [Bacillota bacterium]HHW54360.1 chemotaxis protein CheW [Bacillota bacterium]
MAKEAQIQFQEEQQLVVFRLGSEEYGVDILQVQEIKRMLDITRVPQAPDFIEGVINLRGQIIPVLDLRRRFAFPAAERTADTRIIVVNIGELIIGLIVDTVLEVISLSKEAISPAPALVTGIDNDFLSGIGDLGERLLIILNLEKILAVDEFGDLQDFSQQIEE